MTWLDDEKGKDVYINGVPVPGRKELDFVGGGVSSTDSANRTTVNFGTPETVDSVAALRASTIGPGDLVATSGYAAPGDGGGGAWISVTGASPGTYTDNGGTIVIPSGGDGSAAWLRLYSGPIDVRWFGASASASAAANATAFNSAQATGKLVALEPGATYAIDSTLSIQKGFICDGETATIRQDGNATVATIASRTGVTFHGVRFEFNGGTPTTSHNGLQFSSCSLVAITRCEFDGFRGEGIKLTTCSDVVLRSLKFTGAYSPNAGDDINDVLRDIYVTGTCSRITIDDIRSTSGASVSIALQTLSSSERQRGITISNCKISGCRTYGIMAYTLALSGTSDHVIECEISDCVIRDIKGDLQTDDFYFGSGIYLQGDVRASLNNVRAIDCNQSATNNGTLATGCFALNGLREATLTNCWADTSPYHGYDMVASDITEGYTLLACRAVRMTDASFKIRANAATSCSLQMIGCKAYECSNRGFLSLDSGSGPIQEVTLADCLFLGDGASNDGVFVHKADTVRIHGCTIDDFANHGVQIDDASNAYVHGNTISNVTVGLYTASLCAALHHYGNHMVAGVTNKTQINAATTQITPNQFKLNTTITGNTNLALSHFEQPEDLRRLLTPVAAAGAIVLTVDPDATTFLPIGTRGRFARRGAGTVTFAAGGGVTINSSGGALAIPAQYEHAELIKMAADTWDLVFL